MVDNTNTRLVVPLSIAFSVEVIMKVAYTVGRFQPPTIGHKSLIEEVMKRGKAYVFVSYKQDKLNPLSIDQKMPILNHMFQEEIKAGKLVLVDTSKGCGGPAAALACLRDKEQGKQITFVVGDHPDWRLGGRIWGDPPSQPDQVDMLEAGMTRTKTVDTPEDLEPQNMSGTKARLLAALGPDRKADFYKAVGYEGQRDVPEVEAVYTRIQQWVNGILPAKNAMKKVRGGGEPESTSADTEYDITPYLPPKGGRKRRNGGDENDKNHVAPRGGRKTRRRCRKCGLLKMDS